MEGGSAAVLGGVCSPRLHKRPPAATVNRQPRDFTRRCELLMHAQPSPDHSTRVRINFFNAAMAAVEDGARTLTAKAEAGQLPDEHELRRLILDGRDVVRLADELAGRPGVPFETAPQAWQMYATLEWVLDQLEGRF